MVSEVSQMLFSASTRLLLGSSGDIDNDGFFEIGKVFGGTSSIESC
jgi:hypothetical protein